MPILGGPSKNAPFSGEVVPTVNALPQSAPTPGLFTSSSDASASKAGKSREGQPQSLQKDSSTYQMLDRSVMLNAFKSGGSGEIQKDQLMQCKSFVVALLHLLV
jgi:hypothetical protein